MQREKNLIVKIEGLLLAYQEKFYQLEMRQHESFKEKK